MGVKRTPKSCEIFRFLFHVSHPWKVHRGETEALKNITQTCTLLRSQNRVYLP